MDYRRYLGEDVTYSRRGNVIIKTVYDEVTKKKKVTQLCLIDDKEHKNKDVIQSYITTAIKYDFSVYEKRILYRIVECFQHQLEGKKLDVNFKINKEFGGVEITIPISSLLLEGEDKNYDRVKKAIVSMESKRFLYENTVEFGIIRLVERPTLVKYDHNVKFSLHPKMYNILLDFTKGYRRYELNTAMAFRSVYSMRFYELLSGQNDSITYSIENLKAMFRLGGSYKYVTHFVNRVIEPARRELDLKAPYSFTYTLKYEFDREKKGRNKVVGIIFTPVYHLQNRNKSLAHKDEIRNFDLKDVLIKEEIDMFLSFNFTENELKDKYHELLKDINQARKHGKIIITSSVVKYARKAKKQKSYLIKTLRKEICSWKESLVEKQNSNSDLLKNEKAIDYQREKDSVNSFLKNHLGLSGKKLEKGITYVMQKGGGGYFNELISSSNGDNKKIMHEIMCGINKLSSRSDKKLNKLNKPEKLITKKSNTSIVAIQTQTQTQTIEHKLESISVDISKTENKLKIYSSSKSECEHEQKQLIECWKKIVLKKLSLKEKVFYFLHFKSDEYLKKKAEKKGLDLYK